MRIAAVARMLRNATVLIGQPPSFVSIQMPNLPFMIEMYQDRQ